MQWNYYLQRTIITQLYLLKSSFLMHMFTCAHNYTVVVLCLWTNHQCGLNNSEM